MRSFCFVLLMGVFLMITPKVSAQEDSEGIPGANKDGDAGIAPKTAASGETIMDSETLAPVSTDTAPVNFLSLKGTPVWTARNGLGAHAGFGGYTCMREYCNTTLDANYFGSISLILGAYFRINPNLSIFADLTIAHLNTNFRNINLYDDIGDNRGVAVQFIFGPTFHLPVKGWLDLYTSLGIGPIALRAKTDTDVKHRWGGFDIEWTLGADFYFWSVGTMKNFSVGPFMKFGFPIWAKVCEESPAEVCSKPSEMANQEYVYWSDTPFTFQLGLEARYDFSLFGNGPQQASLPDSATKMDTPQDKDKKKSADKKDDIDESDVSEGNSDVSASDDFSL